MLASLFLHDLTRLDLGGGAAVFDSQSFYFYLFVLNVKYQFLNGNIGTKYKQISSLENNVYVSPQKIVRCSIKRQTEI